MSVIERFLYYVVSESLRLSIYAFCHAEFDSASPLNIIKYETNSEKTIFTATKAFSILFIQTPKMVS